MGRATARDHERLRDEQAFGNRNPIWSDEFRDAVARLTKLTARVFDDGLQKALHQIRHDAVLVLTERSYEGSAEAIGRVNVAAGEFNERVAPLLRRLFEPIS